MARDIAAGMEYLAKRCFIHRVRTPNKKQYDLEYSSKDLAARNILLDEKLVCKV